VEKEDTLHNSIVLAMSVPKIYQSLLKFDIITMKTILTCLF